MMSRKIVMSSIGAVLITTLSVMPVRILKASSTETPEVSKVDVVLQNVTMNAWLNNLPNKGNLRINLLNIAWPLFVLLKTITDTTNKTIAPIIYIKLCARIS